MTEKKEEEKSEKPEEQKIKIKLESYDHKIIDQAVSKIVETARRTGARLIGPVLLPTRIKKYTVNRSPHVDKKSREQFEIRYHKRLIYLINPTQKTSDELMKMDLPSGVEVRIHL